jgi:soluble lytic murein transglycosylase-like protein
MTLLRTLILTAPFVLALGEPVAAQALQAASGGGNCAFGACSPATGEGAEGYRSRGYDAFSRAPRYHEDFRGDADERRRFDRHGSDSVDDVVVEASRRFGIPTVWIRAVISQESGGDVYAVSSKGAMGLMQIMPQTWRDLRARYGFGRDPFDPHDNVHAGTAYLRELHDRYGMPGFLAAYNAGPARYEDYLTAGRPLPAETVNYVSAVAPRLGVSVSRRRATGWE